MISMKKLLLSSLLCLLLGNHSNASHVGFNTQSDSSSDNVRSQKEKLMANTRINTSPVESQSEKNSPRNVNRPKIEILNDKIYFDSKILTFGASLESWRRVIGGHPRCFTDRLSWCVWDSYGLEVSTDSHATQKVKAITIYFAFEVKDPELAKVLAPTPEELYDWLPHQQFPGHLELDGFAIGAKSKFREIRSGVSANRLLGCGVSDCSNPAGAFSQNAHLYLVLDGRSENSMIRTFSVEVEDGECQLIKDGAVSRTEGNIEMAKDFHRSIAGKYHPNTFTFNGGGMEKKSFEKIIWTMKKGSYPDGGGIVPLANEIVTLGHDVIRTDGSNNLYIGGRSILSTSTRGDAVSAHYSEQSFWEVRCCKWNSTGDGTVPGVSGRAPRIDGGKNVLQQFELPGVGHETAFRDYEKARIVTYFAITKLAALASRA